MPWAELPALAPKARQRLEVLRRDMEEAYGAEHVEPWDVRRAEIEAGRQFTTWF